MVSPPQQSFLSATATVMDSLAFELYGLYALRVLAFFVSILVLFSVAFHYEFRKLNCLIRRKFNTRTNSTNLCQTLDQYRAWHTRLCRFVVLLNTELVSPFFFSMILCNLPFNACTLMYLLYNRTFPTFFRAICAGFLAAQILLPGLAGLVLIPVNHNLYSSAGDYLRAINWLISSRRIHCRMFREKWKAASYYEVLHVRQKRPLLMTAGSLGSLNRKSLFEVKKEFCFQKND